MISFGKGKSTEAICPKQGIVTETNCNILENDDYAWLVDKFGDQIYLSNHIISWNMTWVMYNGNQKQNYDMQAFY